MPDEGHEIDQFLMICQTFPLAIANVVPTTDLSIYSLS